MERINNLMNILKNVLREFFTAGVKVGPLDILINLLLAALMSYLIYYVYVRFGNALSNRKHFGKTYLLITVCTCLIIALIRSSIALSLGLVGALSIVRFRTAIKEPEELTYLFLCIAVGLGFGANERLITISATLVVLVILIIRGLLSRKKIEEVFNLSIQSKKLSLDEIVDQVKPYCTRLDLRKFDKKNGILTVMLFVEFKEYEKFTTYVNQLEEKDESIEVHFLSTRSMV